MDRVRRRLPWVAAGLLHAGLLALLALVERPRAQPADPQVLEIEVASETPGPAESEPASPELEAADVEEEPAPSPRRAARAPEPEPAPAPEPEAEPPPARPEPGSASGGAIGENADSGLDLGWQLGGLGTGEGGLGGGGGAGSGAGARGGGGGGSGGGRAAAAVRPAVRRISRARPPRLVYPRRFRDERPGEVFIALLTIDEDGWVVGVRLVQGVNPHADEKALTAVWRFHYEPARDAAGRPTRSRVRQRFMVD